jgi:hypothetical protein
MFLSREISFAVGLAYKKYLGIRQRLLLKFFYLKNIKIIFFLFYISLSKQFKNIKKSTLIKKNRYKINPKQHLVGSFSFQDL